MHNFENCTGILPRESRLPDEPPGETEAQEGADQHDLKGGNSFAGEFHQQAHRAEEERGEHHVADPIGGGGRVRGERGAAHGGITGPVEYDCG